MTTQLSQKTQGQVNHFRAGIKPAETCTRGEPYKYCLPNGFWYCCDPCAVHKGKLSGVVRREQTFERDVYINYYRALGVSVNEPADELGLHRNQITNVRKRDGHKLLAVWQTLRQAAFRKLEKAAHIVRNAVWKAGKIRDALMHNEQSFTQGMGGDGSRVVGEINDSPAIIDRIARGKRRYRRKDTDYGLHNRQDRAKRQLV